MSQATNTMGGAIEDCAPTAFAGKSKSIAAKPKKQGAGSKPAAKAKAPAAKILKPSNKKQKVVDVPVLVD